MLKKEDLQILKQLILALDEAGEVLEKSYLRKDLENFEKTKKYILEAKSKIDFLTDGER
ncbi:MAG TPA: hypothetical protein VI815_03170 [Candidatus Nanoarchaeia archaeon]|nr:hypothetical protein [Candidatus Nanoarchaeia archaeon]